MTLFAVQIALHRLQLELLDLVVQFIVRLIAKKLLKSETKNQNRLSKIKMFLGIT